MAAGRNPDRLVAVAAEAPSGTVDTRVVDIAVPDQARALVHAAAAEYGRIHVLVNNAGIALTDRILDMPEQNWHLTLATNLSAAFFASQEAARHMVACGGGAIVNVASIDGLMGESPQAHYNVSKAGLIMLTESFAHEVGHLGVRCNAVAPGMTVTPMVPEVANSDFRRDYLKQIPMRRFGRPEEQAAAILFLASEDASFVNGATIVVDGGQRTATWYDASFAPPSDDSAS